MDLEKQKKHTPDSKGVVVIRGLEEKADKLRLDLQYQKRLKKDVDDLKVEFRRQARDVLRNSGPGVKSVLFRSAEGVGIACGVPDIEKPSSRTKLSERVLQAVDLERLVGETDGSNVVEVEEKVIMTGKWAAWAKQQYESWKANGVPESELAGIKLESETRLTRDGISILEAIATAETVDETLRAQAQALLDAGVKAGSISAK